MSERKHMRLGEAAAYVGEIRGKRVSPQSVYRWWREGVEGVRLNCLSLGGVLTTRPEDIEEFGRAVAEARRSRADAKRAGARPAPPRVAKPLPDDEAGIERELDRIGV